MSAKDIIKNILKSCFLEQYHPHPLQRGDLVRH